MRQDAERLQTDPAYAQQRAKEMRTWPVVLTMTRAEADRIAQYLEECLQGTPDARGNARRRRELSQLISAMRKYL